MAEHRTGATSILALPGQVVALCREEQIDLVLIGPENSLAAGSPMPCEQPVSPSSVPPKRPHDSRRAKVIAVSLPRATDFPRRETKRFRSGRPRKRLVLGPRRQDFPVVVKADGLASGKGVVIPESAAERDEALVRLAKSGPILLEERLTGPEVSLLVFSDGISVAAMPPAQDHKRIYEGDRGPNTGGMGAYAPTGICPPAMVEQVLATIVRPTIAGLAREGTPYVGVLYAGLMLTADGPKLIEYNCRFGDPEAQTLLPLLATPLREIVLACLEAVWRRPRSAGATTPPAPWCWPRVAIRKNPKPATQSPDSIGPQPTRACAFFMRARRKRTARLSPPADACSA